MILRRFSVFSKMACSRYEYVKNFELDDRILPNVWIVVRIDGKGFHKFSDKHGFKKPNDDRALNLMNHAAIGVMQEYRDIVLAFGESDEYSFVFRKGTEAYNRRSSKLLSYVCSHFTSMYVLNWNKWFPDAEDQLKYAPTFDARTVAYPSDENLRDYLSWRQADTHINNLYNTTFWALVQEGGLTRQQAEERLRGSLAADKNEILFADFKINYNGLDPMLRKGTILLRKPVKFSSNDKLVTRQLIVPFHCDLIREEFWRKHPELLDKRSKKSNDEETMEINGHLPPLLAFQHDATR